MSKEEGGNKQDSIKVSEYSKKLESLLLGQWMLTAYQNSS